MRTSQTKKYPLGLGGKHPRGDQPRHPSTDKPESAISGLRAQVYSLRTKLILPYVILTLMTAMVGTYVVTRLVTSSVRERFVNQLFEASRVAADGFVRQEKDHLANLRLIAFTDGVAEAMGSNNAELLQELVFPLVLNNDIEAVALVDLQGREVLTLARDPDTSEYLVSQGSDFSNYDPVRKILDGEVDPLGDKFADLVETSGGSYIFTSAPVRDIKGSLFGVIMVGTRLESLIADLEKQALADVTVLELSGKVLSTTFAKSDEGYGVLELTPEMVDQVSPSLTREISLYNRRYQVVYAPLMLRQEMMGVLAIALPSNYIVTTEATSRTTFSLIFSLATVGVIIIGYVLSQSIARPISRLRSISQAVAAGDLNQTTGFRRSDEIGELAAAFDVMTFRLRRRTAQAARLYAETVKRNEDLADSNARLQEAQHQLVQSEKLAAVGHLTAGIVHDVKNPLAVIKGLAEELQMEVGIDANTSEQLTSIRDNATRANAIVSDLLKFARQSKPEMRHQDLRETIRSAVRLTAYLARKGNVEVKTELPYAPVMAPYDAQQLEQVLINLIQNAIQAMPDGGVLKIGLKHNQNACAIIVQDTGIGIPEENIHRIFDPFFTTKPAGEGTGLGLSTSYGIVSRHRGRIDVESKLGKGTTFTVLLPTHQPVAEGLGV